MTILLHVVSTACEKQQPILTGLKKEDRIFELDLRYRKIWVKGGKSRLKKGGGGAGKNSSREGEQAWNQAEEPQSMGAQWTICRRN